jgi:predicted nucleotidyltransferase
MMTQVSQQSAIEQIARTIVDAFHPRRIVLFGSRARGDARADSDVDLMVEMDSDLRPLERMRRVYQACRDRSLPLDVVVFTPEEVTRQRHQKNSLVSAIESEGKVIYEQR